MKHLLILLLLGSLSLSAERVYTTFDVQAYQHANLAFSAGGIVQDIQTDVAMQVKQGDLLATLANQDLKAKLQIAKIAATHAEQEYQRQLSIKNVIQKSKLDLYKFQYDSAKAQIDYLQALIDKTVLKAPFDGIITAKKIEKGDVVSGIAPRTAFSLQSEHKRTLILSFDQKYWHQVQTGNAFEYTIDGDTTPRHGVITKVYPSANSANRKMTAEVYATDLIVGLFGTGYITIQKKGSE